MKRLFVLAVSAVTAAVSCQKDVTTDISGGESELYAVIEDSASTRTYMDEGKNVRWSEEDQVVAFMRTTLGLAYQIKPAYVGRTYGYFSKVSSGASDDLGMGMELDHNVIYYPYADETEIYKSGPAYALDVVLPSEQNYLAESFASGSFPMVAVSEDNNIAFKNICGGMKLQFKGNQRVASIRLEGKSGERLSGAAKITAYPDQTSPALTMSDGASTCVTLDCGGVQLNENTSTSFIISLPPVLFSKGFSVTVTDTDGKTYTVGSDKANTVVRSSLLVMPAFRLGSVPDQEKPDGVPVTTIFMDRTSLILPPEVSYTFLTELAPFDATDKTLTWSSSDASVASVDHNGQVTAHAGGSAVITAVAAGGASASCNVTVVPVTAVASIDYIDEYGVNHGKGVAIGDVVWAPVNCGYKAATSHNKGYPFGKLYQWGRKYGQGYNDEYDEAVPELVQGPVMPSAGQAEVNAGRFYYTLSSPDDWSMISNDKMWNSGPETSPHKTSFDPCPEGWRVSTRSELSLFINNKSAWTNLDGQNGYYFSGIYTYSENTPRVFLPAAGARGKDGGDYNNRNRDAFYWSSTTYGDNAFLLIMNDSAAGTGYFDARACGCSVRCVQE